MPRFIVVVAACVAAGSYSVRTSITAWGATPQNGGPAKIGSGGRMVPQFQYDKTWPKEPLPAQWKLGQGAGGHVDARDNVWIIPRPGALKECEKEATELA